MLSTYRRGDTFLISKIWNDYRTNDILYFRYPETDSTVPKTWCIQRLVGLPGDTIEIKAKQVLINNYAIKDSSTLKYNYFIKTFVKPDTNFKISYFLTEGGSISDNLDYSYSLTRSQARELQKDSIIKKVELKMEQPGSFDETVFPYSTRYNWNMDHFGKIYLPKKNDTLLLDTVNIVLYSKLISVFEHNQLRLQQDTIFINEIPAKKYVVKLNYYFVLGDNRDNANDSRIFGLLPESYIKGKVSAVLRKQE